MSPAPMPPARERDPHARQERIVAASGLVFATSGFEQASVREIADRGDVRPF